MGYVAVNQLMHRILFIHKEAPFDDFVVVTYFYQKCFFFSCIYCSHELDVGGRDFCGNRASGKFRWSRDREKRRPKRSQLADLCIYKTKPRRMHHSPRLYSI